MRDNKVALSMWIFKNWFAICFSLISVNWYDKFGVSFITSQSRTYREPINLTKADKSSNIRIIFLLPVILFLYIFLNYRNALMEYRLADLNQEKYIRIRYFIKILFYHINVTMFLINDWLFIIYLFYFHDINNKYWFIFYHFIDINKYSTNESRVISLCDNKIPRFKPRHSFDVQTKEILFKKSVWLFFTMRIFSFRKYYLLFNSGYNSSSNFCANRSNV